VDHTPLVSVVIPAYNCGRTIARAIESALGQHLPALDVVVVDDGSTDDTRTAVARFGPQVRLVTQPNRAAAAARNRAISESRGRFVAFLDADDEWLPGRLERGVAPMLDDASVGATFCRLYRAYPDGTRDIYGEAYHTCRTFSEHLWPSSYTQTSGATCRRTALDYVGPFDESLQSHDDLDLWIRIGEAFRIVEIAEPLAVFHDTPGSYSKTWDAARSEDDYYRVIDRALTRCPDRYASHRSVIMADAHLHWGILYLVRGNHRRARLFLRRSLAIKPTVTAAALLAGACLPHRAIEAVLHRVKQTRNRAAERGRSIESAQP
jgi:glycosyltransferase involved in cell wall biosynthesis